MTIEYLNRDLTEEEISKAISYESYLISKRNSNQMLVAKYEFGKCRICSDVATGIHYGVSSCEGCKGFFKRSIVKHISFICYGEKNCIINPKQVKKCKYCRWNACLKAGMCLSLSRKGRIPNYMKSFKSKDLKSIRSVDHNLNSITNNNNMRKKENFSKSLEYLVKLNKLDRFKSINVNNILPLTYFSQTYLNTSNENQIIVLSLLKDKSLQLYREHTKEFDSQEQRALKQIESGTKFEKYELTDELKQTLLKHDLNFLKNHASCLFQMINELAGFQRFSKKDIQTLISNRFFALLFMRTIKLFIDGEYYFMISDSIQMNKQVFGDIWGEEIRDVIFNFYSLIKSLDLTQHEIALLIPLILCKFNEDIENQELLKEINEYYCRAILYQFNLLKRSDLFIQQVFEIISKAPEINKMCFNVAINSNINEFHV